VLRRTDKVRVHTRHRPREVAQGAAGRTLVNLSAQLASRITGRPRTQRTRSFQRNGTTLCDLHLPRRAALRRERPGTPDHITRAARTRSGHIKQDEQLLPDVAASLIHITGGSFGLLTRLLTLIQRVLDVNDLHFVSTKVVEAARDSLVIGVG
jgi:hypothetical protein